jgi:hypothetical protein
MGITARRQVQQNCFEGRAGPRLSRAVRKTVREENDAEIKSNGNNKRSEVV